MTTLEKIRAEITELFKASGISNSSLCFAVLQIFDKYMEQESETTVSVLPDENGYYPNVCGMCANAESELCKWCSGNKNFKKERTKIPDSYKKYAEQEPTDEWQNGYDRAWELAEVFYEEEPCDDAVSRQAIMKLKRHNLVEGQFVSLYDIEQLPSVRPQEQTGHWIKKDGYSDCSECGSHIVTEWDYCPNCGARMVEPQESEEISDRNLKMWEAIFKAESENKGVSE